MPIVLMLSISTKVKDEKVIGNRYSHRAYTKYHNGTELLPFRHMKLNHHRNGQDQEYKICDNIRHRRRHVKRTSVKAITLHLKVELLPRWNAVEVEKSRDDNRVKQDNDDVDPDADPEPSLGRDV